MLLLLRSSFMPFILHDNNDKVAIFLAFAHVSNHYHEWFIIHAFSELLAQVSIERS